MRQFPQVFNRSFPAQQGGRKGGKKIGVNCALINQRRQGEREEKQGLGQYIASIRRKYAQVGARIFS